MRPTGDANLAIHVAGHFFELAGKFFGTLPIDNAAYQKFMNQPENVGKLISASTNLALSVELYLKGLAIKTKNSAIWSHKLVDLFDDLPPDCQQFVKQRYSRRFEHAPKAKLRIIHFFISTQNQPPFTLTSDLSEAEQQDVRKILAAEADAFQTWRYVYEQAPAAGYFEIIVHYAHLCIIVNSIQDAFTPPNERP